MTPSDVGAAGTSSDDQGQPVGDSDELILVADDQGRYVDASPAILRRLGYSRKEMLGMAIWDLTPVRQELDGLILWQEFISAGHQVGRYKLRAKSGRLEEFEYEARANVAPGQHLSLLRPVG